MQNEKEKFKKDFIKRLIRFSVATIKFCQNLRKDRNLKNEAGKLLKEADEISKVLGSSVLTLKGKR